MAKSSIHIQAGAYNFFRHNDRSQPTKNSIFDDEQNECSQPAEAAYQEWKKAVEERAAKYTERTGQKLNKKTITHLSAIVNLEAHHTLADLQPLADYLEEEFGMKIVQTAIHRDEGHWGEDGEAIKNYHAHLEAVGLDEQGNSVRRKLSRSALSKLQTKTAQILGMQRGANYAKERKPRPKRLDTYEFKVAKEREEQGRREELAKIKDITEENRRLREQLREAGASRAEYAELERTIRVMREQARAKEITIEEMQDRIAQLEQELVKQDTIVKKIEELAAVAGVEPEQEEPRATDQERFEAAKFLAFAIGKDWIKINKEWDGESQISTQEEIADYIQFTDENMDRAEVTASKLLSIWDVYCVSTRAKSNVDVKMLEQKGAFSRFYSIVKEKSRVDKAIELISSIMDKISGKSSTPSPVAQSSTTNHENRNMNRRGFRP